MERGSRAIDPGLLEALRKKARAGTSNVESVRARGVVAYFEGKTYAEIREQLGWADHTTRKWTQRVREQGLAGLARKPRATPQPRVRSLLDDWLPGVIHQNPRSLGHEQDRWTLEALRALCEEQTGEMVCLESVRLALHRLGNSWKRAKRTITSPDPEYEAKRGPWGTWSKRRRKAAS